MCIVSDAVLVRLCCYFKSYHAVGGDLCSRAGLYCFPHIEQCRESAVVSSCITLWVAICAVRAGLYCFPHIERCRESVVASSRTTLWVATDAMRAMCNVVFVCNVCSPVV